jgi:uncharacterized membrane protein
VTDINKEKSSTVREIDGRLHSVHDVRDAAGKLITQIASPLKVELRLEDIAQLLGGAFMLGVPVSLTEEVWMLGETLPAGRILLILAVSLIFNALFVKMLFYRDNLTEYPADFFKRVCASYGIAFAVAMLLLTMIDMGPFDDPILALKRAVIIALPTSFAAISVDYIR